MKIFRENPNLVKIVQMYGTLYVKTHVCFIMFAATYFMSRNSTNKALFLHGYVFSMFCIADSDIFMVTMPTRTQPNVTLHINCLFCF
jgi:hypothetical protein